jgi:hypothetical protein
MIGQCQVNAQCGTLHRKGLGFGVSGASLPDLATSGQRSVRPSAQKRVSVLGFLETHCLIQQRRAYAQCGPLLRKKLAFWVFRELIA